VAQHKIELHFVVCMMEFVNEVLAYTDSSSFNNVAWSQSWRKPCQMNPKTTLLC
jgi:hypothetical protein